MEALSVCAAVVHRDGKLLLATRRPGGSLAGKWEFPGGKIAPGEDEFQCIVREMREELGVAVEPLRVLCRVEHRYPEKLVLLNFVVCGLSAEVEPVPLEGQRCGWFTPEEAVGLELAPADAEMLEGHLAELRMLCAQSVPSAGK